MRGWLATVGVLLAFYALLWVAGAALRDDLREWRSYRFVVRAVRRVRRTPAEVVPLHRPIERIAADLRRLHTAFHRGGMRFAKYEGCRQAYDRVLGEAADVIEVAHLMDVLPPGDERDRERDRVEWLLVQHGLLPSPWAA